jgi:hypothetical protein
MCFKSWCEASWGWRDAETCSCNIRLYTGKVHLFLVWKSKFILFLILRQTFALSREASRWKSQISKTSASYITFQSVETRAASLVREMIRSALGVSMSSKEIQSHRHSAAADTNGAQTQGRKQDSPRHHHTTSARALGESDVQLRHCGWTFTGLSPTPWQRTPVPST